MPPRISVVVPLYNVAAYVETCLESLAQQTAADVEIVMVEDGSTDATPAIAEGFAARDPRFQLVRQANAGLGAARNTGVTHATGEFLAFADSDDVVPRRAYEVLAAALEQTGSDFASGNVRRLTSFGTSPARFLADVFERTRLQTHITRFPALLADRTAWNKLFRRRFWDRHGFRFPEGVLYEDTPVTLPAHYLAASVDVVDHTVYLWRTREGDDLSITQRRTEPRALRDRVNAVDHVSRFLAEAGLNADKLRYDRSVVEHDLRYFLDVLDSADDDFRRLFIEVVNDFLDRADPSVVDVPLAIDRLKWHLVRRRALPELLDVLGFEDDELPSVPPVRHFRRWYGNYPYRTDRRLRISRRVYRLNEELALVWNVNDVRWEGKRLRIEGFAYIEMIGAADQDAQRVDLLVRPVGSGGRPLRVRAEPLHRPDVTADADEELANLDWSGFVATVDPDAVRRARPRWEGNWEIGIVVRASGVRRTSWDPAPAPFHPAPVARLSLPGGGHLRADLTSTRGLAVRERRRSVVRSYFLDDAVLQLEGDAGSAKSKEAMLQLKRRDATATLHYPTHVDGSGERTTFLARVPVADLLGELDIADHAAHTEYEGDGIAWDVNLAAGDSRVRLALEEALPETAWTIDGREVGVHRTRHGNFTIVERSFRPVLKSVEWSSDGKLLLGGVFRAPKGSYDLELAARRRGESYGVPLAYEAETGRFSAELKPGALPSFTGPRPLGEGVWELLVRRRGSSRETAVHVLLDHELLGVLPLEARLAHKRFVFGVIGYRMPVLAVGRDLDDGERGGHAQRRLRTSFYRSRREAGLRDVVLYECFGGTEWSDSPLAIHGELVRRQAPFEHLWVVRDGAFRVPDTAVAVRELSEEYYEAYARARYVVGNDYWPWWATRRPEQTWLQTWHGPPLKRLGRELASYPKAVREYRRVLRQPSENWQYVASPSPAATSVLERAFPVSGEVVETGLPRTDILVGPDRERLAESVKRRLGLPADKRVVLYAPTYRDHLRIRDGYRFGPLLDLRALSSALRGDHVLLVRKHRLTVGGLPAEADGVVLDVSAFPDATELLLAVDVLVTDYSSAIFDFAVTRRPIVFFTPDLESYRDEIRGFSIDFEADAPGPLLKTTEEVLEALRQPETIAAEFRERYDAFVSKYCPLADGGVASRLVERLFSW